MVNPGRPSPDPNERRTCWAHDVANTSCGGPHRYVNTTAGLELLGPGQAAQGTPAAGQEHALDVLDRLGRGLPLPPNPRAPGNPND